MRTCRASNWHMCVWVYACGRVCLRVWYHTHTCSSLSTMQKALSPKQTLSLYTHGHCLIPRTVPLTLPLLKAKHTVCYGWKKTLGEERKAFPETHLVLMQGPLVWITGTYYRRTQAHPSSLSRGKWEPALVMGAEGPGAWGAEGWVETCGQAATPHDWCPSSMREFLWDLFKNPLEKQERKKKYFFPWTSQWH